jgi:hypothetical protein
VTKTEFDLATSRPLLIVVSRPCARTCEASESALLNVLLYIDDLIVIYKLLLISFILILKHMYSLWTYNNSL